jgi:hypothetical protein
MAAPTPSKPTSAWVSPPTSVTTPCACRCCEHLGVKSLRLMTNNPRKVKALTDMVTVAERVPLHTGHNPHNKLYLATKASKLDHMMGNEHQGEVDRA